MESPPARRMPRLSNDAQLAVFSLVKEGMSIEDALREATRMERAEMEQGQLVRSGSTAQRRPSRGAGPLGRPPEPRSGPGDALGSVDEDDGAGAAVEWTSHAAKRKRSSAETALFRTSMEIMNQRSRFCSVCGGMLKDRLSTTPLTATLLMHDECGRLKAACYDRVITPEEACVLSDRALLVKCRFTTGGGVAEAFKYALRSRKMVPLGGDGTSARLEFDPIVTDGVAQGDHWPALVHAFGPPADLRVDLSGSFSLMVQQGEFERLPQAPSASRPTVRHMRGACRTKLFGLVHTLTLTFEYHTDSTHVAPVKAVLEVSSREGPMKADEIERLVNCNVVVGAAESGGMAGLAEERTRSWLGGSPPPEADGGGGGDDDDGGGGVGGGSGGGGGGGGGVDSGGSGDGDNDARVAARAGSEPAAGEPADGVDKAEGAGGGQCDEREADDPGAIDALDGGQPAVADGGGAAAVPADAAAAAHRSSSDSDAADDGAAEGGSASAAGDDPRRESDSATGNDAVCGAAPAESTASGPASGPAGEPSAHGGDAVLSESHAGVQPDGHRGSDESQSVRASVAAGCEGDAPAAHGASSSGEGCVAEAPDDRKPSSPPKAPPAGGSTNDASPPGKGARKADNGVDPARPALLELITSPAEALSEATA